MTLHAIFKGNVQGVGFRATVLKLANIYGLKGTVANLDDGTVEAYFQGDLPIINQCIDAITLKFGNSIQDIAILHVEHSRIYDQFEVRT